MTLTTKHVISLLIAGAFILGCVVSVPSVLPNFGSGTPGTVTNVATSSFQAVTAATAELLFATSSCSTRVISTNGGEARLTFSDYKGDRPTSVNGVLQAASTTVTYEAEVYGCNALWVYPYATGVLNILETQ